MILSIVVLFCWAVERDFWCS